MKHLSPRALEYFRIKGYRVTWGWRESLADAHTQAFTVAKTTRMEVLRAIRNEVDRAIAEGSTFDAFRQVLQPRLQELGWWGRCVLEAPDPSFGHNAGAA